MEGTLYEAKHLLRSYQYEKSTSLYSSLPTFCRSMHARELCLSVGEVCISFKRETEGKAR